MYNLFISTLPLLTPVFYHHYSIFFGCTLGAERLIYARLTSADRQPEPAEEAGEALPHRDLLWGAWATFASQKERIHLKVLVQKLSEPITSGV